MSQQIKVSVTKDKEWELQQILTKILPNSWSIEQCKPLENKLIEWLEKWSKTEDQLDLLPDHEGGFYYMNKHYSLTRPTVNREDILHTIVTWSIRNNWNPEEVIGGYKEWVHSISDDIFDLLKEKKEWCKHIIYGEVGTAYSNRTYKPIFDYRIETKEKNMSGMLTQVIGEDWDVCPVKGCEAKRPT